MTVERLISILLTMPQNYKVCDYDGNPVVGAYSCWDDEDDSYWVQLRTIPADEDLEKDQIKN